MIPVYIPEDPKDEAKFRKEMNKIHNKYNLYQHLPKLLFEFDEK